MGAAFAAAALSISNLSAQVEDEELLPSGGIWEYLLYAPDVGGVFTPSDPSTADADFYETWHNGGGDPYDGPAFTSGQAPLGYDVVTGDPLVTDIWGNRNGTGQPPSGNRYSAYFRTTVTPTTAASALRFTGILDDGAVVYVNGVEVGRSANMDNSPDLWNLLATATGSESTPQTIDALGLSLPGGVPVQIGVVVHSQSTTSSDMGMNFRIVTLTPPDPEPPANDNFVNAEFLLTDLPQTVVGRTHDLANGVGATTEAPDEPLHGGVGQGNVGSIWYNYQPLEDVRLAISVAGSSFDAVLSVYTGNSLTTLTEVASSADEVPFYPAGTVLINATGGTPYWIAIDGASNGGAPVLGENFGNTSLTVSAVPDSTFVEIATLLPAGSNWFYLLAAEDDAGDPALTNQPVDPALFGPGDADFHTTWHTAAGYNGPAFSGPAPALLGYGVIDADADPVVTDIWGARDIDNDPATDDLEPPSGLRYAAYFRTTFTPTSAVPHLGFRGLIDDGAAIFINGVQVSAINFTGDASNWQAFASNATNTELAPQESFALSVNLPANVPVEIAVTVRNNSATSSDMGFDLEVYSIEEPVIDLGKRLATNDPMKASFEIDTVGLGDGGTDNNLPFEILAGAVSAESGLPNPPAAAGNAVYANNGAINFVSGNIDLTGVDNSLVAVAIDFRSFQSSTSGFETGDTVDAFIEGSTDGLLYTRLGTIKTLAGDGDGVINNGELDLLERPGGAYTTFSTAPGVIGANIVSMRIVVNTLNNSNSEHFFLDNVTVGTAIGPGPPFLASIEHNRVTGENTIRWNNDG